MHTSSRLPSVQSLLAFESTARLASFKAAGEELRLTPSAISHRIKILEALFGQPLFYRETRSISLTPRGCQELIRVRGILAQLRELKARPATGEGLKVCAPPLFFNSIILVGVEQFQEQHGQLDLHVVKTRHQLNQFDVAIHYGRLTGTDRGSEQVMTSHHVAVRAPWLAEPDTTLLQVLSRHRRIDYSYAPRAWRGFLNQSVGAKTPGAGRLTVTSMSEAVAAAKTGIGVALVIEELVREELRNGSLRVISDHRLKGQDFYLSHKPGIADSTQFVAFRRWIKERCSLGT